MSTDSNSAEAPAPSCAADSIPNYETLQLNVPKPFVYHVQLKRPEKYNAMNKTMWLLVVLSSFF